ncbi:hypothetical protein [Nocardioides sp. zg-1228]|uniref:hypothetical protein n=1 Tax=Nocardioides sp. zg-1228 TaxID=2763008 RepID=UPI0016433C29|nr:hypothetical protein [Nocardioides sp. zg-1228]MBC2931814.1 hypothetical protein [Nocardioides sp. zg-1228]QSF57386.1 hypothetical protein JX575_17880 [Nocardioides sp. zg-1228]
MRAGRRLTTALAAAGVVLSTAFVAGPVAAAPDAERRTPPDVALTTRDVQPLPPPAPLVVEAPGSARTSSARAARRPLFAFWGKKYNRIDGFGFSTAIRGSGTGVQVQAAWKTYRGVKPIKPKKVFVQARVDGGKWRKVSGARGKIGRQLVTARIPAHVVPAGVPAQQVDYRLKTKKITKGPRRARRSVASKPVSVRFENQAMYTGDQARFYAPIASLCPNANITIDTTGITGDRTGVFSWQHGITMDAATLATLTAEPEISKLGIAIHECAHMKQFYNWGGTREGWDELVARSAEVFVPDVNPDPAVPTVPMAPDWAPLEHAADCAKELISPERYRTYGGYCNPTEYAAAGLLWQDQRY